MSTAMEKNLTGAVKRMPTVNTGDEAVKTSEAAPRFAPRQAKPFDQKELFQYKVPDFTPQDLLSAIPSHCFERSTFKSSLYLLADFAMVAALVYAATWIDTLSTYVHFSTSFASESAVQTAVRYTLWTLYSFTQGLVFTGIWVIAHECGHRAFSPSKDVNNTVGWFLHSALLVPYHSWRISHARHHAGTGHMTRDEVFVPRTREHQGKLPLCPAGDDKTMENVQANASFGERVAELLEDAPLFNFLELLIQQLVGWPLYLLFNVSGQMHFPKGTNHFNPDSVIFDKRHRGQVMVSNLGIGLTLSALCAWAYFSPGGWEEVAKYYIVPYLWTNNWLVMITYLQHTDPLVPHYDASVWTFPRGALCTVDRNWLGPVGPWLLHGISETHVVHHVCSKIPHYHAWEASQALQKRIGVHYMKSNENVLVSLWKTIRGCRFVEKEPVAFYRNSNGVPKSTAVFPSKEDSGVSYTE